MRPRTSIQLALAALTTAAVASPAFGAGEPKNELPFVRPAAPTLSQPPGPRVVSGLAVAVAPGEPKNESPFTARFNADPGYAKALREAAGALPLPRPRPHRAAR